MAFPSDAALKNELLADPAGLGYPAMRTRGAVQVLADLLNQSSAGNQVSREAIPANEIFEAITLADYTAASAIGRQWLQTLFTVGSGRLLKDDGTPTTLRANLLLIFGPGTATRTNLGLIEKRTGSRAQLLWGPDVFIRAEDVQRALAS